jgi:hypothetical protein
MKKIRFIISSLIVTGMTLSGLAFAAVPPSGNEAVNASAFITAETPAEAGATGATGTTTSLGQVSNFGDLVSLLWSYGSQVIIAMAIFFIVLGAFFYVASGGDPKRVSDGKEMIFGSFIAMAIVLFSGVLIRTLHKPAEGSTGALADIPNVINNATNILVGVIGAFTILMLTYAGLLYVMARGDEDKIEKAHRAFRYGVIGLVMGILAFTIVRTVVTYLL